MMGRFIFLAATIALVSVGMARVASHAPGAASVSKATTGGENDNWTRAGWTRGHIARSTTSSGEVRLERAGAHFYADTSVGGTDVRMMVDSGASLVALTRADAESIGIDVDGLAEAGFAETAGGRVPVRPVMLDSISVGGIEVRHVAAAVIDADMGISLLGQSYLSRLDAVNVEGDVMTLR